MPITFTVAAHPAKEVGSSSEYGRVSTMTAEWLLEATTPIAKNIKKMIQTSVVSSDLSNPSKESTSSMPSSYVLPRSNGFGHTILEAHKGHHHLVLRSDDLWLAILAQFSQYVNGHAEDMRSYFVAHEGQKNLVHVDFGTRHTYDFRQMVRCFIGKLDEELLDKELKEWILPAFSTTTGIDEMTAAVMMMSTFKKFFRYYSSMICGIPSVTLLGKRSDYEEVLRRVEKLSEFGVDDLNLWKDRLLQPALSGILNSWKKGGDMQENRDFWLRVVDYQRMSGGDSPSGWITAFCCFNTEGKWLLDPKQPEGRSRSIKVGNVPPGWTDVPVQLNDNGLDAHMVAGLVGMKVTASMDTRSLGRRQLDNVLNTLSKLGVISTSRGRQAVKKDREEKERGSKMIMDTVQPYPAWFMFVKGDVKDDDNCKNLPYSGLALSEYA